jgi:hypothetical protein
VKWKPISGTNDKSEREMTQVWTSFDPGPAPFLKCWYCPAPLKDHYYADIGSVVAGSKEQELMDNLIDSHEWSLLPFPVVAAGGTQVVVFRAIRCPYGGGSVTPLILATSALRDDMIAGTLHMLSAGEVAEITRAGTKWRPYSATWTEREQAE